MLSLSSGTFSYGGSNTLISSGKITFKENAASSILKPKDRYYFYCEHLILSS